MAMTNSLTPSTKPIPPKAAQLARARRAGPDIRTAQYTRNKRLSPLWFSVPNFTCALDQMPRDTSTSQSLHPWSKAMRYLRGRRNSMSPYSRLSFSSPCSTPVRGPAARRAQGPLGPRPGLGVVGRLHLGEAAPPPAIALEAAHQGAEIGQHRDQQSGAPVIKPRVDTRPRGTGD